MQPEIKIMYIVNSLIEQGGAERVVYNLVERLNLELFYPVVCCLYKNEKLGDELKNLGIKIVEMNLKSGINWSLLLKLSNIMKKERINIVHTHTASSWFYGTIAAKLAKIPVIINTVHGRGNILPQRKEIIERKILSLLTTRIISVSEQLKKSLIEHEGISLKKVITITNGVDINRYRVNEDEIIKVKKTFNLDGCYPIIGIVARLDYEKNHQMLLNAMPKIVSCYPEAKLLIVGTGSLEENLQSLTRKLNLSSHVLFLGFHKDVSPILATFDLFVLPSRREGMPLTLLEAMSAGKPIVATNVGGIPEVVEDKINGFLVPSDNYDSLADAIIKILQDKNKMLEMGKASRSRAEEYFSLEKMITEYENLYINLYNEYK
ncbi:MAG: glycosyltransferase [Nitrospirota bacterium]